jgi:two-component system, OmpR family, sensor kinase
MDGFQRRLNDSLQAKLSVWLSLAILSVACTAGLFAFFSAFNEAHELQDDTLRQVAAFLGRAAVAEPARDVSGTDALADPESRVFVRWLPEWRQGASRERSNIVADRNGDAGLALPADLPNGLRTVAVGDDIYRVLIRPVGAGRRLAVAQDTAVRDEIALASALRTSLPFLLLVPILLLVMAGLIRKAFRPVRDLSAELDRRHDQELAPIAAAPLPAEIRPFVVAVNRLLERVRQAVAARRRFIDDAAHELRSPLAAISLQAERLAGATMSSEATARVKTLRHGIDRARNLVEQMLDFARAQDAGRRLEDCVSVRDVYRQVLQDLVPLAEAKHIDIGVLSEMDAHLRCPELDLVILVRNLVDNAIRYTPEGGRVDLSVRTANGATVLEIADTGPGIAEAERERVFDPFHRLLGSHEIGAGLGLSIVRNIAAQIGATVTLDHANLRPRAGLRVNVTFPATDD